MSLRVIEYPSPAPPAASDRRSTALPLSLIAGVCLMIPPLSFILPYPIGTFLNTVAFVVGAPLSIWAWVLALIGATRGRVVQ